MWLVIFGIVILCSLAGLAYMVWLVSRLPFIVKLSKGSGKLGALLAFLLIAVLCGLCRVFFSTTNVIVIFLHFLVFYLVSVLIGWIMKRAGRKPAGKGLREAVTFIVCLLYLCVAYYLDYSLVATNYEYDTDKEIRPLKIAMIADSHIGTTFNGDGFAKRLKMIEVQKPDILLIAGDYVDDSTSREDMVRACEALGETDIKYGVWYAFGNHDRGYYRSGSGGFSEEELVDELRKNHVHVLKDEAELVDDDFYVIGRNDSSYARKTMDELLDGLDTDRYMIVIDHEPNDYDNEAASGVDLVLSGHTHGGQLFPVTYVGEWFNINDRTYGHEKRGNTDFIVTSGISDWEIRFKTGTRSEYVIVDVK